MRRRFEVPSSSGGGTVGISRLGDSTAMRATDTGGAGGHGADASGAGGIGLGGVMITGATRGCEGGSNEGRLGGGGNGEGARGGSESGVSAAAACDAGAAWARTTSGKPMCDMRASIASVAGMVSSKSTIS